MLQHTDATALVPGGHILRQRLVAMITVIVMAALASMGLPGAALAQVPQDPSLVPVTSADAMSMTACVATTEIVCGPDGCSLQTRQVYTLRNTDTRDIASLTVGMLRQGTGLTASTRVSFEPSAGITLDASSSSEQYAGLWDIRVAANATSSITISYEREAQSGHLMHWRWDTSSLSTWGAVDGMNIALSLPAFVTERALVSVDPANYRFDGRELSWEYERPEIMPRIDVILLSPATWQREESLSASGSHHELGRLYEEIQRDAAQLGVSYDDLSARILAEYQLAAANADSAEAQRTARLDLARLFRDRATAEPDLALNYVILAARELEQLHALDPGDQEIATSLSETYDMAARIADSHGDTAGALSYVTKASTVTGAEVDHSTLEELTLAWAVEMAENGMVSQALTELEGVLPDALLDDLLHYAPDIESVRTEVNLGPSARTARYHLRLYPPKAAASVQRIEALVSKLHGELGLGISLAADERDPYALQIEVRAEFVTIDELREISRQLAEGLGGEEQDTVGALLAAPWQTDLILYERHSNPWRDRYLYHEALDLTTVNDIWAAESQYASWRLIELRAAEGGNVRSDLENRLALFALRDQVQIWDALPDSSYWVVRVAPELPPSPDLSPQRPEDTSSWLVAWGQSRSLDVVYPVYHRRVIVRTAAGILAALALVVNVAWLRARSLNYRRSP